MGLLSPVGFTGLSLGLNLGIFSSITIHFWDEGTLDQELAHLDSCRESVVDSLLHPVHIPFHFHL